jgi:hypothetical protein
VATSYKVLGQLNPTATTMTNLYTVPGATSAVCSTLSVANLGPSTTFRIAVRPVGAALVNQHYIAYDTPVNQYDTVFLTIGVTLAATDIISVYAGTATVAFSLFGSEIA